MVFHKYIYAENLEDSCQTEVDIVDLFETGDHEVSADGDPDLGFDGILGSSIKGLDSKVLFDPFEKEFDAPSGLVDLSYSHDIKGKVIGKKDKVLTGVRVNKMHSAQNNGIKVSGFDASESDTLITPETGIPIDRTGLAHLEVEVASGTNDKESPRLSDAIQSLKVHKAPVHYINASRFQRDTVKEVNIMHRSFCDIDKYRDRALKGHLGVEFDGRFSGTKSCPGKHWKTQVNSCGIDSVNHLINIQSIRISHVEALRPSYQNFGYICIGSPIPLLVSVSEIGACDPSPDAHGIQEVVVSQTGLNVAQSLPEGQLGENHGKELIAGTETFTDSGHGISLNATRQLLGIEHVCDLRENHSALIHPLLRLTSPETGDPFQIEDTLFCRLSFDYEQYTKN